jgi:hypothetical protein
VLLVVDEALSRREALLFTLGLVLIDRGDGIDHPGTLVGKKRIDLDKFPPTMHLIWISR